MSGQIVEDNDIAFGQGRGQLGLDPGVEDAPVRLLIDHEGGGQAAMA